MALRIVGGQTLWANDSGAATTQVNTATIDEWFLPTSPGTLVSASTPGTFVEQNAFHALTLNGNVDAVVIQGSMFIQGISAGDRLITAGATGSTIRAYAFAMPITVPSLGSFMAVPACVTQNAAADVAINATTGTASILSTSSSCQLACKSMDQAVIAEQIPLFAAATNDGYTTATCCQGIYIADGTVPANNDTVNWAFSIGWRTNALATAAPTGMMPSGPLSTSGIEKIYLAIKNKTLPTGGTTTMVGTVVLGRIYAIFYRDLAITIPTSDLAATPDKTWAT